MKKRLMIVVLTLLVMVMTGCAGTMKAIEHGTLSTSVRMSDSIMLDATSLAKGKNLYIRVTNTSELQELIFEHILLDKLIQKGYVIVQDPEQANYIITANVLQMGYHKEGSITPEGMLAGGWGGALLATGGKGWRGPLAGAMAIGAVGSIAGGIVGQLIKVGTYVGVVDLQIQEKVRGGVTGRVVTEAKQGTVTTIQTEQDIKTDYQIYRTRIVASATKTNISRDEAALALSEGIAVQISGLF